MISILEQVPTSYIDPRTGQLIQYTVSQPAVLPQYGVQPINARPMVQRAQQVVQAANQQVSPQTQAVANIAAKNQVVRKPIQRAVTKTAVKNPQAAVPAAPPVNQQDLSQVKYSLKKVNTATTPEEKAMHTETGFNAAKKLAAARLGGKPPQVAATTIPAGGMVRQANAAAPPIVPGTPPAATVVQPVAVQPAIATSPPPAIELTGAEHFGRAAQKGLNTAGEAAGTAAKKAMEYASEHPAMAGITAGALGAVGLRKLLNRNKQ